MATLAAVVFVRMAAPAGPTLTLIAAATVAGLVFVGSLLAGGLDEEDRLMLASLRGRGGARRV